MEKPLGKEETDLLNHYKIDVVAQHYINNKVNCSSELSRILQEYTDGNFTIPIDKKITGTNKVKVSIPLIAEFNEIYSKAKDNIPIPLRHIIIPDDLKQKYINEVNDPIMKEIHKKIVSNIRYIDYDTFYNSLLSVVESFNKEIKNEYMVVFDAPCSLNELGKKTKKSGERCYSLIKDALIKKPTKIMSNENIEKVIDNIIEKNIWDLAIFDDAIYSGAQMESCVYKILRQLKARNIYTVPTFWINVPFMTNQGENMVSTIKKFGSYKVKFQKTCKNIKTVGQLLTEEEQNARCDFETKRLVDMQLMQDLNEKEKNEVVKLRMLNGTLLYFQHKIPDFLSLDREVGSLMRDINGIDVYTPYRNLFYSLNDQ